MSVLFVMMMVIKINQIVPMGNCIQLKLLLYTTSVCTIPYNRMQ